jgi:transposase
MEQELKYEIPKLSPKEQEAVRKKIIREMKKRGDAKEVAEICECTVRHVNKTWKKYQADGIEGILGATMGRPKGLCKKLTPDQEASIKQEITGKNPSEAGLSGYLWGRAEVCELVKQQIKIKMPL